MQTQSKAEEILKELNYDFASFDLDGFLRFVGERKGCEIVPIPWEGMPLGMFGMWMRDRESPIVYILYRCNVPRLHQAHIQLHEVAHFLLGHFAPNISQKRMREIVNGSCEPPFDTMLYATRSEKQQPADVEAETLASLIQQQAVRHAGASKLARSLAAEQRLADFLKGMRLA